MEMLDHPHYVARESLTRWQRVDGGELTGQNVTPKLKRNPGRIWRGCPLPGMDNEDILGEARLHPGRHRGHVCRGRNQKLT